MESITILEKQLREDIEERYRVLENAKTFPIRYNLNESDKQFFRNYSVLTIYAIWEGFVRQSFQTYIRELNKLDIKRQNIADKILTFTLENNFKQLREYPERENSKIRYFERLNTFFQEEIIEIPVMINTKSNVSFDVINELLSTFNLEVLPDYPKSRYSLNTELRFFIDQHRNPIAHGNADAIRVKTEDITRFTDLVIMLMDEVFIRMITGFENKTYLKSE